MTKPIRRGRTVRIHEQRSIERSQEEAFFYVADFSNIEAWDPGVARSRRIDEGPLRVGSRFDLQVTFGSRSLPMIYEIAEFEPPNRVVLAGAGDKLHAVDEIRFSYRDGGTLVDYTADLTFDNFIRFLLPFLNRRFEALGDDALDGLVEALER